MDATPSFENFKLNKQLLNAIDDLGYQKPSLIQEKAIPLITAGHDVMGVAQTGTGKTAAFVLPILMKVKYAQGNDPRALIVAPTRELILQIEQNVKELAKYTDLRHVAVYGGIGPKTQIEQIEAGVDILLATPGRFMDIYLKGHINTKQIKTLVLDEADKMMDMGFMPQIRKILEVIPVKRQNLLFSATMPEKVVKLSEEFLEFPEVAEVTPQASTVSTIDQVLYQVPNVKTKIRFLEHLLQNEELSRIMVFTKTKTTADNVFKYLERKGLGPVRVIHGNKGQNSRINAINQFREGELRILVSTDVTARGIDISMVTHVINFDVPIIYEDYVHRIGRTGRAENDGIAITFANKAEMHHIGNISKLIQQQIPEEKLPAEVEVAPTDRNEQREIDFELDQIKRKNDPNFKGAFHEKKRKFRDDKKRKPVKNKRRRR
ncbi:DEAD/DEAH box helicase [Fulvivirga sp. RKSG066]|uniref:DEAD/DEAH box helicase n=1 Tax=Fulvivirga aurantia TaxID=2529383 RepID=UPI0012BB692B|nr:DEAD/DEAH box helicase [Fulvivirga aurantia]MTI21396.1 DEAD/DEAH box helicase [Fulvivirga aurantia]